MQQNMEGTYFSKSSLQLPWPRAGLSIARARLHLRLTGAPGTPRCTGRPLQHTDQASFQSACQAYMIIECLYITQNIYKDAHNIPWS